MKHISLPSNSGLKRSKDSENISITNTSLRNVIFHK